MCNICCYFNLISLFSLVAVKKGRYSLDRRAEAILESRHYYKKSDSDPVVNSSTERDINTILGACDSTSLNCNPGNHSSSTEGIIVSNTMPPGGVTRGDMTPPEAVPPTDVVSVELPQLEVDHHSLASILGDSCTEPPLAASFGANFSQGCTQPTASSRDNQILNQPLGDLNHVPLSLSDMLPSSSGSKQHQGQAGQYWIHPDVVKRRNNAENLLPDVKPQIIPQKMTPDMIRSVNPFSSNIHPPKLQDESYIKQEPGVTLDATHNPDNSCMFGAASNPIGYHPSPTHSHSLPELASPNIYSHNPPYAQPPIPCASNESVPSHVPCASTSTSAPGYHSGPDMQAAGGGQFLAGTDVAGIIGISNHNSQMPGAR